MIINILTQYGLVCLSNSQVFIINITLVGTIIVVYLTSHDLVCIYPRISIALLIFM